MPFAHTQPVKTSCLSCKHYTKFSVPPTCAAFPRGIPEEILNGKDDHKRPFRGDNGIQYEEEDE